MVALRRRRVRRALLDRGAAHPSVHVGLLRVEGRASRRSCATPPTSSAAANVRVNAVRPSIVPTELAAPLEQDPAVLADYLANMPISRTGTVDDVAHLIRFLCGPESSWITGQCIGIDGGHTLRRGPNVEHWARADLRRRRHRRHATRRLTRAFAPGDRSADCLSSLPTGR